MRSLCAAGLALGACAHYSSQNAGATSQPSAETVAAPKPQRGSEGVTTLNYSSGDGGVQVFSTIEGLEPMAVDGGLVTFTVNGSPLQVSVFTSSAGGSQSVQFDGAMAGQVNSTRSELSQGCAGGQQKDCVALATFYWQGIGVPRDLERARALLRQACEAGYQLGCSLIALIAQLPPP